MEKPVRIAANDKIRTFNEKVRNGLEHALNFMMADDTVKMQIGPFDPFLMPLQAYLGAYKKKSIMIKIHSQKAWQGELYWFFELKSAVVLGSMLRRLPPAAMQEKVDKETFDEMDQDAFGEVGNQLCGILDRAFRTLTNKNIHLKMDFKKTVYPDETLKPEAFVDKEEFVVLLSEVTLPVHGKQKLTLLLPRSLYEVLLNLEIQLTGITPKVLYVYSHDEERLERLQAAMNSRYTKVMVLNKPEQILEKLETPNLVAVGLDMKTMSFPLPHADAILIKRMTANRNLMRMPLFVSWDGANDSSVLEMQKLGLQGATKSSLETGFPIWAQAFTQDPSKASSK